MKTNIADNRLIIRTILLLGFVFSAMYLFVLSTPTANAAGYKEDNQSRLDRIKSGCSTKNNKNADSEKCYALQTDLTSDAGSACNALITIEQQASKAATVTLNSKNIPGCQTAINKLPSKQGATECDKVYPIDPLNPVNVGSNTLCILAFAQSYKAGTEKAANCGTKKEDKPCQTGAKLGKAASQKDKKASEPKNVGKDAANQDGSDRDAICGDKAKYGFTSKQVEECKKAYDAQIVKRAEAAGKKLKEDGGDIKDCTKIGFGSSKKGSKTQNACEKGFKAGKVKNPKGGQSYGGHDCGDVKTFFDFGCGGAKSSANDGSNPIVKALLFILNIISALVTLGAVGAIVYGGLIYASAADNSGQTKKGIEYIVNAVIGLLLWLFAYALINFLVPGGLFN